MKVWLLALSLIWLGVANASEWTEGSPAPSRAEVVGGRAETTCDTVDDGDVRTLCLTTGGALNVVTGASTSNIGDVDVEIIGQPAVIAAEQANQASDVTLAAAVANTRLFGWSVRESAASAALTTVVLRHDTVATTCDGPVIAYVELDANQSTSMWYGDRGVAVASGVCADILAGTASLSVMTAVEAAP